MTKDYAKNRSRPSRFASRRNGPRQSNDYHAGLPSWAWMLLGLFFGTALSAFVFWKLTGSKNLMLANPAAQEEEAELSLKSDSGAGLKTAKNSKTAKAPKKTRIIKTDKEKLEAVEATTTAELPALDDPKKLDDHHKVVDTKTAAESRFDFYTLLPTVAADTPEEGNTTEKRPTPYIIQAGSFKTRDQAERLKATLALQGLEARIQTVTINPSESWYRVYIGPFDTKADALGAQQGLENGPTSVNSMILKVRV